MTAVVHRLPGRIRLYHAGLRGRPQAVRRVEEGIGLLDGVSGAAANPVTGTVLVTFDASRQSESAIVKRLSGIVGELRVPDTPLDQALRRPVTEPRQTLPVLAQAIESPFKRINTGLFDLSGGYVDLRYLVPILFVGYGTVKLVRQGPLPTIPWYLFYWWAFRVFVLADKGRLTAQQAKPAAP